jgi:putative transposase
MQWLATAQVRRSHQHDHSSGHVWQGRFKAFPIQNDEHLATVLRSSERNPVRAGLVADARQWEWSSLRWWSEARRPGFLHPGPLPRGRDWRSWVNAPMNDAEVERLRGCIRRGTPFGSEAWVRRTASRLGLEASLRPRGRPRKEKQNSEK